MKNEFCDLPMNEIHALPEQYQGFLLSRFYKERGFVFVPEDTFKEMIDIVAAVAKKDQTETTDQSTR